MTARVMVVVGSEDLRSHALATLSELGTEIEVLGVAENTTDALLGVTGAVDLDVVLLDDQVGPLPYQALVRDVLTRVPDVAVMVMSADHSAGMYQSVMDSGARALLSAPPSLDELTDRLPGVLEWQRHLRASRATSGGGLGPGGDPGRLIAFTGAKGGVGTSTLALHTALLGVASNPERKVCVIDLDLQQRGLGHLLDVSPRRTVADLVLVADAMTGRNLDEASIVHRSGLRALLAPPHGEQSEDVNGEVARQLISTAKAHYDLILVDTGSVVTEATAVAMEFADQLVVVATPDVPTIRATQDKLDMLERLQIAKSGDAVVLFNKVSPRLEIQPEFGAKMLNTDVLRVSVPEDPKRLEAVANSMAPTELDDGPFRRAVIALGRELSVALPAPSQEFRMPGAGTVPVAAVGEKSVKEKRRRRGRRGEDGQVTIEALVGIAFAMVLALVLLQVTLLAVGAVSSRSAADAATRIGLRGGSHAEALSAAKNSSPGFYSVKVRRLAGGNYRATLRPPSIVPFLNQDVHADGTAAEEDR